MKVLLYNQLNPKKIPNFKKFCTYIEKDNFTAADVKKVGDNLYRARLNKTDRLLFSIYTYETKTYILVLEYLPNHAYDKSRFLHNDAQIDEAKIPTISSVQDAETVALPYINANHNTFHILDKILSLDDIQNDIYQLQPPLIIIGSAGSGKTALTLEKMKQTLGDILYVTHSPYLVHNSRNLYYAMNYVNEDQEIAFLSFEDYLSSIHVPQGKEMPVREFMAWFTRQRGNSKLKDGHQLLEEFKGVITGTSVENPYLMRDEYLNLGVKQSIFSQDERTAIYDLFEKYLAYMQEKNYYDTNIISYQYLDKVQPHYDFIIVDEVQDLTNIQLQVILKSLRHPTDFILCGDSNQIVHPNFFSWAHIKSLFYKQEVSAKSGELIRVLNTNYRNSPQVTEVANKILKIKNARFGSIDRESNYLVDSNIQIDGRSLLLQDSDKILRQLNQKSKLSTHFAVIVMRPEQKAQAKKHFSTPLVFSVQEAKGLEYESIILYNFVSNDEPRFREICKGVDNSDLEIEELTYARVKDKTDKSLEIFKFYVNALYVAMTRAVRNLYMIESNPKQRLFNLLDLHVATENLEHEQVQQSSLDEWRKEAHKLEMQGKQEQAEEIRHQILKQEQVPWEVINRESLDKLQQLVLEKNDKKAKVQLFEYALVYSDFDLLQKLIQVGFSPANNPKKGLKLLNQKYYVLYEMKHTTGVTRQTDKYGVDFRNVFNQTPLMIAARLGRDDLMQTLLDEGANPELIHNMGLNAFQIALEQAIADEQFARKKLAPVYEKLEPDNIVVQIDERLVSIDNHLMEFTMLNIAISMFYVLFTQKTYHYEVGLTSINFVNLLELFPEHIIPERRKKRPYISSILSKNEVDRDNKYNRKLFKRTKRGHYIINPNLSVRVEGEWKTISELFKF
ncbi:MAG: UvrD-helicase domain-containing protein [Thiotrichaceae bacterium]|nr:UvrD-helicase domain-containing protein [Thiotrichaceae bacterium]